MKTQRSQEDRWLSLLPLPPPPQRLVHALPIAAEKKQGPNELKGPHHGLSLDEKLSSLCSYRKDRGLCMRCAEKWHPNHKCESAPQLHALQEIWTLCQDEFSKDAESSIVPTVPHD